MFVDKKISKHMKAISSESLRSKTTDHEEKEEKPDTSMITSMYCGDADKLAMIPVLSKRYDKLQLDKRCLEVQLSKIPLNRFDKFRLSAMQLKVG